MTPNPLMVAHRLEHMLNGINEDDQDFKTLLMDTVKLLKFFAGMPKTVHCDKCKLYKSCDRISRNWPQPPLACDKLQL